MPTVAKWCVSFSFTNQTTVSSARHIYTLTILATVSTTWAAAVPTNVWCYLVLSFPYEQNPLSVIDNCNSFTREGAILLRFFSTTLTPPHPCSPHKSPALPPPHPCSPHKSPALPLPHPCSPHKSPAFRQTMSSAFRNPDPQTLLTRFVFQILLPIAFA